MRWYVVLGAGLLLGCQVEDREFGPAAGGNSSEAGHGGAAPSGGKSAVGGRGGGVDTGGSSTGATGASGAPSSASGGAAGGEESQDPDAGAGSGGAPETCGNGTLDDGEDCDEGDANSDDTAGACNTHCQLNECDADATQSCSEAGAQGNCAEGEMTCEEGRWSDCSVEAAEADDCAPGDDANCNGEPNEGCGCVTGEETTCGEQYAAKGECANATLTCTEEGTWPANESCAPASAEVCGASTEDEDCDGEDDELDACNDCPTPNPCKNGGTCVDGDQTYTCECAPGSSPVS